MIPHPKRNFLRLAWQSHVGRKRDLNEDSILVDGDFTILLLADGMGGHNAGEIASLLAVQTAHRFLRTQIADFQHSQMMVLLAEAMQKSHIQLRERIASDRRLTNMGTTLLAVIIHDGKAFICNIGDSRAYILRKSLRQITSDHAIEDRFISDILMADEGGRPSAYRFLTQAVGANMDIRPDHFTLPLNSGDVILLCSDGLTDMLSDASIEEIISANRRDINETARKLICNANHKGGHDNISVILVEYLEP